MDALAKQVETRTMYVVSGNVFATLGEARLFRDFNDIRTPIIKRTITEEEVE